MAAAFVPPSHPPLPLCFTSKLSQLLHSNSSLSPATVSLPSPLLTMTQFISASLSSTSPSTPTTSPKPLTDSVKGHVGHSKGSSSWKDLFSLNSWVVRDYYRLVTSVNAFEPHIRSLSDEQLSAKTAEFRLRLSQGETIADIQAEAFAVVRDSARRKLGMRHYDVQIIGGAVLHDMCIAEMKTGEGKTLVSTLAAYLNALTGDGVHEFGCLQTEAR